MCPDCRAAKENNGLWAQFNAPACLYCCARLIQRLPKLRTPTSEQIAARRKIVLADAIAWGHSEQKVRELAKGPLCYQPVKGKNE